MPIEDFEHDARRCTRCSYCKWIPWESMRHPDYMLGCPSIGKYLYHAYSSSGKWNMSLAFQKGRIDYTEGMLDAVWKCQMDGSCDISCKTVQQLEPLQHMQELRIRLVQDGQGEPAHTMIVDGVRKEDNTMGGLKADRGKWAEGIAAKDLVKEKAEVLFHAGCRYSFDEELRPTVRKALNVLIDAGVDVGIMGKDEACCAGRLYEMGYAGELTKFAEHNREVFKKSGVKTVVTACADCYHAFKVLYDKVNLKPDVEVLHVTEFIHRLLKEGKISLTKKVPVVATYHDPCHLGRLGEPWIHWKGEKVKVMNQIIVHNPPKKYRRGANGIYDVPREILKSIPGLRLVEMYRTRESAWCCGAGGGVKDAYPDFAIWTAAERLKEAKAVGAKAIVSACPWCTRNFSDAVSETGDKIEVYDIVDLVQQAM
ncbi:MAG: Anaerobic glycerol-3-phosphate dehydrogenase subunit C [Syntrophorhabdus sp. PtaU1.Bin050]|nr:MAG: Anaerobic glycerol-3-phosphate dehydrogenase subunit C [Syntrophorhabdus sp. PtaU1.Bin050]